MKTKKILSLALACVMALALAVPAFATDPETQAAALDSASSIPVTISAAPTTFSVTVPTAFPTSVHPDTGATTEPDNLYITNNSSGSIVVSSIRVEKFGTWKLAAFNADLRNADVDSNQIGVSVKPVGGRNSAAGGTSLLTDASDENTQTLLSSKSDEWIIDAKNDGNTDQMKIDYDTNATPVSTTITNAQVATIVITISWNT